MHAFLALDNNAAGRAMRAIAPGRKNDRIIGSETGRKVAALACILIETATLAPRPAAMSRAIFRASRVGLSAPVAPSR